MLLHAVGEYDKFQKALEMSGLKEIGKSISVKPVVVEAIQIFLLIHFVCPHKDCGNSGIVRPLALAKLAKSKPAIQSHSNSCEIEEAAADF